MAALAGILIAIAAYAFLRQRLENEARRSDHPAPRGKPALRLLQGGRD